MTPPPRSRTPLLKQPLPAVPPAQCALAVRAFSRGSTPHEGAWAGRIRRDVDAALWTGPGQRELRDAVALVVSELVTNALQHGTGDVTVYAHRVHGGVLIAVESGTGAQEPRVRAAAADAECGRGLEIVEVLSEQWGTALRNGGRLRVWARVPAATCPGPAVLAYGSAA